MLDCDGSPVAGDDWIYPALRVVPMGRSWAMWWCQSLHERLVQRAGEAEDKLITDRHPISRVDADANVIYADNLLTFSVTPGVTAEVIDRVSATLTASGMVVHEVEREALTTEALGWLFEDGHKIRPTRRRVRRCRLAVRAVVARGRVSGRVLEKLVGHLTFVSLLRRESMAILSAVYAFIRAHYREETVLWPSVRRELELWDGLAPLVWADLRRPWHPEVSMVDASHWGLGVVGARHDPSAVAAVGRWSERWRFSAIERSAVTAGANRALAAALDVDEDQAGLPHVFDADSSGLTGPGGGIPEVPDDFLDAGWKLVASRQWRREEHINALESKAIFFALRRVLRATTFWSADFGLV